MKNKGNMKLFVGIIVGALISAVGVYAAVTASSITYSNTNSGLKDASGNNVTNVQGAIDALSVKANRKRYADGEIVYYNPVTDTGCSESTYNSNSNKYGATGCMRWFAYLDTNDANTVHLLLDHNTTDQIAWDSNAQRLTFYESAIYTNLQTLATTNSWDVELEVDPDDSTASQTPGKTVLTIISANEIADITQYNVVNSSAHFSNTAAEWFYFETAMPNEGKSFNQTTYKSRYWWLYDYTYDCTNYGCMTSNNDNYAYWTKTNIGTTGAYIWYVYCIGNMASNRTSDGNFGVRPVVIVPKSKLM